MYIMVVSIPHISAHGRQVIDNSDLTPTCISEWCLLNNCVISDTNQPATTNNKNARTFYKIVFKKLYYDFI